MCLSPRTWDSFVISYIHISLCSCFWLVASLGFDLNSRTFLGGGGRGECLYVITNAFSSSLRAHPLTSITHNLKTCSVVLSFSFLYALLLIYLAWLFSLISLSLGSQNRGLLKSFAFSPSPHKTISYISSTRALFQSIHIGPCLFSFFFFSFFQIT